MLKIGIITLYHKNYNYGGILQAYAMQNILYKLNYNAKLVTFDTRKGSYLWERFKNIGIQKSVELFKQKILFKIMLWKKKEIREKLAVKKSRFDKFMNAIPHTEYFSEDTIKESEKLFDCYVVGSDQVWNPGWWNEILLLGFTNLSKIAYAASIGRANISADEAAYLKKQLETYKSISVREKQAQILLRDKCGISSAVVLDPTLLVNVEQWEDLATTNNVYEEYALIYNLGNANKYKKEIYDYCRSKNIKVICIGYSKNSYFSTEEKYADYVIYDAGPQEWLGLIKKAKYVFSDSFHGTVFSIIFKKNFYCFERDNPNDKTNENSRLYSFLQISGLENRLLKHEYFKREDLLEENIDFKLVHDKLESYKEASLEYLYKSISGIGI